MSVAAHVTVCRFQLGMPMAFMHEIFLMLAHIVLCMLATHGSGAQLCAVTISSQQGQALTRTLGSASHSWLRRVISSVTGACLGFAGIGSSQLGPAAEAMSDMQLCTSSLLLLQVRW